MVGALTLPTGASAEGWLPFIFASPADREADQTKVGVDKDGNVTAIWRDDEEIKDAQKNVTIRSAVLSAGASAFGAPVAVTTNTGASDPQLAVTELGTAVATWRRFVSAKFKIEGTNRVSGTWTGSTELSDPGDEDVTSLVMAMAPNGEGLFAWKTDTPTSYTNNIRLISGGGFAPPPIHKITTSPYPGNNEPDVAVSSDGSSRYLVGHNYDVGNTKLHLYKYSGTVWDGGASLAEPTVLPDVAVAPNGEPVSAWMTSGTAVVNIKRGGNPIVPVADPSQISIADLAVGPATEEFPNGMVLYAWLDFIDDGSHACCKQVLASVGDGVTMSPPIELSDELEEVVQGSVRTAVGPDGTGYVAWTRYDGDFFVPQATVRPPKGSFDPLADDLTNGDAYVTDLVTAADGRAIVGIQKIVAGAGEELYFRAGISTYVPPPPPPPPPPDGGSPPGSSPPPPGDIKPPKVKVRLSRASFAPGDKLNQIAVKPGDTSYVWKEVRGPVKEGTRVLVTLDEDASLSFKVDKLGCATGKPANPTRNLSTKCKKPDPDVQHFRASGKAGAKNKYVYLGSWSGGKVKPGAVYEFEVVATDKFGNSSRPQRVSFKTDGKQNADGF
jgi:hypothetical protein